MTLLSNSLKFGNKEDKNYNINMGQENQTKVEVVYIFSEKNVTLSSRVDQIKYILLLEN